uniref:NADH-ubiquinone oxidoreductase chain 4L n=2 Tax=Pyrops candelaria TaxID=553985 RepID=A0A0A0RV63_PYRCD|nr:NADH dehydrogenase subunit 4L [Pyrops candelaria]
MFIWLLMMLTCLFGYFSGLLMIVLIRKHFLLCLLVLEYLLLFLYFLMFGFLDFFFFEHYFLVIFLVFGVCDGVIGLSLLVFLIRKSSGDYLDSLILC